MTEEFYEEDLGTVTRYYLIVDGSDGVEITDAGGGSTSTVSTHDNIVSEAQQAASISWSDVPDDILHELEDGRDDLL